MSKGRTTVSMPPSLHKEAVARQKELRYPKFSEYVRALIEADVTMRPNHVRTASSPLAVEAAKIVEEAGHVPSVISPGGASTKPRKGLPLRGTSKRTSHGRTQQDKGQQ